jgi:hypothetical protein
MAIYQLKERCWATDPASLDGDDERQPHYDTEAGARRAITEAREENADLAATVRQLGTACWVIQCDGECEQHIDEEDECYISHCESRQEAQQVMTAWRWTVATGEITGDEYVFCEGDRPEGLPPLPPSPAELEAAGQLVLPGVA